MSLSFNSVVSCGGTSTCSRVSLFSSPTLTGRFPSVHNIIRRDVIEQTVRAAITVSTIGSTKKPVDERKVDVFSVVWITSYSSRTTFSAGGGRAMSFINARLLVSTKMIHEFCGEIASHLNTVRVFRMDDRRSEDRNFAKFGFPCNCKRTLSGGTAFISVGFLPALRGWPPCKMCVFTE